MTLDPPGRFVFFANVDYEFGRGPRFAARSLEQYQDRVLMGKDPHDEEDSYTCFRVLDTEDDSFDDYRRYHALWQMYGLGPSDEALGKICSANALRLVPAVDRSLFPG